MTEAVLMIAFPHYTRDQRPKIGLEMILTRWFKELPRVLRYPLT